MMMRALAVLMVGLRCAAMVESNVLVQKAQDRGCSNAYSGCCDCAREDGALGSGKCMNMPEEDLCRPGCE